VSASDNLGLQFGPQPLFHGSMRPTLGQKRSNGITPVASRRGAVPTYASDEGKGHDPTQAFATDDPGTAWKYAETAWGDDPYGRRPSMYAVLPKRPGSIEPDPDPTAFGNKAGHQDYQSREGFKVIRKMPFPKDWGDPTDWDR
jgi:hypothetical protein